MPILMAFKVIFNVFDIMPYSGGIWESLYREWQQKSFKDTKAKRQVAIFKTKKDRLRSKV
jgi:hypothetical protein